jgi:hypothetical protein
LASAWTGAKYPYDALAVEDWLWLFRSAGFTTDTADISPPKSDLDVYRGCLPDHRLGLAWTTNPDCARWFAKVWLERRHIKGGRVYAARVRPDHVLGIMHERSEDEVVIDPSGLFDVRLSRIGNSAKHGEMLRQHHEARMARAIARAKARER